MNPDLSNATIRTIAMPRDANPSGDIFGGWLVGQMDMAGGSAAMQRAGGRVVTVAIDSMSFHRPVVIGDEVTCCTAVERIGSTSIAIRVEAYRRSPEQRQLQLVTSGLFTYVHVDPAGRPIPIASTSPH